MPLLTQSQVAEMMQISRARVQQIELRALEKLRNSPEMRALAEELGIETEGQTRNAIRRARSILNSVINAR